MLSGVIAKKHGEKGLPEHTLNVKFKGSAGQSFGLRPSSYRESISRPGR
ncbi:hypothetical protein NXY15_23105 [Bacteroides thetaiotaomicron]|nr:hypothetical protein NXY15_23105 [Bacteroides thetaiotaomicron]